MQKPQTSTITGVYCTSMHLISDLLLWLQQESVDYYYKFILYVQCVLIAIAGRNMHVQCIPALYTYHTLLATV